MAARGVLKADQMSIPTRIQRSRKAGNKQPANTHYCGRPGKWGNPFVVHQVTKSPDYFRVSINTPELELLDFCVDILTTAGPAGFDNKADATRHAVKLFGILIDNYPERYPIKDLRQYAHLSCWCAMDAPCHVDAIIKKLKSIPPQ